MQKGITDKRSALPPQIIERTGPALHMSRVETLKGDKNG
jgi:hypothetical protein